MSIAIAVDQGNGLITLRDDYLEKGKPTTKATWAAFFRDLLLATMDWPDGQGQGHMMSYWLLSDAAWSVDPISKIVGDAINRTS
jgi:hypothetical protein